MSSWVPALPEADSFGNRLRLLRFVMDGASVQEMAQRCGIPTPTWRTWEHGAEPRKLVEAARKIHAATGVDMGWLVFGSVPATGPGTPADLRSEGSKCTVRPLATVSHLADRIESPALALQARSNPERKVA